MSNGWNTGFLPPAPSTGRRIFGRIYPFYAGTKGGWKSTLGSTLIPQ